MRSSQIDLAWIRRFCERSDLRTYDPYDIWKTPIGFHVKDFYNRHRLIGLSPAAFLALFDMFLNNRTRLFYGAQEYPIVRALAAQALLKIYQREQDDATLAAARVHLDWLLEHSCVGYSGPCWGLGFRYAVDKGLVYGPNTPLTTMTPYALEAFIDDMRLSGEARWLKSVRGIFRFLERDVPVLEETDEYMVTAYSDTRDRRVINAVSYVMYSYCLVLPYIHIGETYAVRGRIKKLYKFVRMNQAEDGSWPYSTGPSSFIDCFHSCIILKNIIKASRLVDLESSTEVVARGYDFVKRSMWDARGGLFRRFARANKPGVIRFDLYDNAEMLNLAHLVGDRELVDELARNIARTFVRGENIYSQIDLLGVKRSANMLRWAVLPYLYASAAVETEPFLASGRASLTVSEKS